jgi:2-polyprenyl-6-methoxyphenol hydroxylase-like FAD-dependent oxidoreductase
VSEGLQYRACWEKGQRVDSETDAEWSTTANKARLLEVYRDFDPSLVALLNMAEAESLKVWELLDMDVLPTWVQGRLALLGDAAHPFLPRKLAPNQNDD